jgi:hypothetical protein
MGKRKYIETPEKKYKVLDDLSIFNTKTKKTLKPWLNSNGYYYVDVLINGVTTKKAVHRLIAEEFIPNPLNKKQVNHIDGNKLNNSLNNLEWSTCSENLKHAFDKGLKIIPEKQKKAASILGIKSRKQVVDYVNNNFYKSVKEASESIGVSRSYLSSMLSGTKKNVTTLSFYNA